MRRTAWVLLPLLLLGLLVAPAALTQTAEPVATVPGRAQPLPPPPPPPSLDGPDAAVATADPGPVATDAEATVSVEVEEPPVAPVTDPEEHRPPLPFVVRSDQWSVQPLKVWGSNDAMRKYNIESIFGRHFYARKDQVLTAARLILDLDDENPHKLPKDIKALQISLNGEIVTTIPRESLMSGPRHRVIDFDSHLLTEDNLYVLTLLTFSGGPCQPIVEPGAWAIIKRGSVDTKAEQLPLPNDLSQLPVPFFDQRTDREPAVQIVFMEPPNAVTLRAAALVASYFGMQTGAGGVRFYPVFGALPEGHAVVLTTGSNEMLRDLADGPSIQMVSHPGAGQGNYKLLVLHGRDPAELEQAARTLAESVWGGREFVGRSFRVDTTEKESLPVRALPRWFMTGRETSFAALMEEGATLVHRGHAGATLEFEFRVSPETLAEPAEWLIIDVNYSQRLPEPYSPPKMDVEFNGIYLETLPAYEGGLEGEVHTERLMLPRKQLRGANRLQFHISAVQHRPLCVRDSADLIENTVSGESTLKLVGDKELYRLPDVESFVYEGLPYTKKADLSTTTIVLPVEPHPAEVGTALSLISNLAGATGRPASGIEFLPDSALEGPGDFDRNIVMVAALGRSPLFVRYSDRLPLSTQSGTLRVRAPTRRDAALDLLRARVPLEMERLAARFLAEAKKPGAVLEMESPLAAGRSFTIVTANRPEELPAAIDLQGYTEERVEDGSDVLLRDNERIGVYLLDGTYADLDTSPLQILFWLASDHWLVLFPVLLIAAWLLSWLMKKALARKEQARLTTGG